MLTQAHLHAGAGSFLIDFSGCAHGRLEIETKDQAQPAHADADEEVTRFMGKSLMLAAPPRRMKSY